MEIKKSFTINQFRTSKEINSYKALLKNNIFQGIEIFYPYELGKKNFEKYTNNIKEIQKYNCETVMHLPFGKQNDLCDFTNYNTVFKRFKKAIDYGNKLNVSKYTLHLGYEHGNRSENINNIVNTLYYLCSYTNAIIMIENMPNIKEIGYSPQEILHIITKVNKENLAFTFDIGHANVSEYSIIDYLLVLRQFIKHIHIHDNNGLSDQHLRFGMGNIDFKFILNRLKDYHNLYSFEILYQDVNDLISYSNDFEKIIKDINEVKDEEN